MHKKNVVNIMLMVSIILTVGKLLGLLKQVITADVFGATSETDKVILAEGLIANIDYLLIQSFSTAFVPIYLRTKKIGNEMENKFTTSLIIIASLISLIVALILLTFSPIISRVLAPTYSIEDSSQLALYIRYCAPVIIALVVTAILIALLKANESFLIGEFQGINQSIIVIALVLTVGSHFGPKTLLISFLASAVFNLIFIYLFSKKLWKPSRDNPFKNRYIKEIFKMMGPLLFGFSMVFLNQQIDKIIVSGLGKGVVTAMSYASVLSNFVCTFIGSVCGILFTYITKEIVADNSVRTAEITSVSTEQLITLLIPICCITVFNSKDIVMTVFGRGNFDSEAVNNCSYALIGYGLMFIPYAIRELLTRLQYGYGNSKQPTINNTIAVGVNIVLSIILSRIIGVLGVTLATSISVTTCMILDSVSSNKMNKELSFKKLIKNAPRWLIGITICACVSFFMDSFLHECNSFIRLFLTAIISFTFYFVINYQLIRPLFAKLIRRDGR